MKMSNSRMLLNSVIRVDRSRALVPAIVMFLITIVLTFCPNFNLGRFLKRFLQVNKLPFGEIRSTANTPEIELLYVASAKDFQILNLTISATLESLSNYRIQQISIIVPEQHLEVLKNSLPKLSVPVVLISEKCLVTSLDIQELKTIFLERYGWVLQQLLKILYVSRSDSDGVLVLDADTVLLCQRNWLDLSGNQILTPTWEYHAPYYKFLEDRKVGKNPPDFTFVSHHMREILHTLGWSETKTMIRELILSYQDQENSPFSIDYELYAQFLYSVYPEKITLEKWGNFESARKIKNGNIENFIHDILASAHGKFASVSFHSYLN